MQTSRLILDKFTPLDKEDYFQNISHDKKVLETFMCKYTETINDLDFKPYLDYPNMFAIRLKETNRLIGLILVCKSDGDTCEIGYAIGSNYWGYGYATEATKAFINYCFEELKFKKVYASYFVGNDKSKHVMEKCGMKYSHFAKDEINYLGISRDVIYYIKENNL